MAAVDSFPIDETISTNDIVLGSNADNSNVTVNYRIGDISDFTRTNTVLSDVTNVTSTELGILSGATLTTTELNSLTGTDVTATEFNILGGATLTTAELNFVDGVTSNIQTQLNAITSGKNDFDEDVTIDADLTVTGDTSLVNLNISGYVESDFVVQKTDPTISLTSDETATDGNEIGNIDFIGESSLISGYTYGSISTEALQSDSVPVGLLRLRAYDDNQNTDFDITNNVFTLYGNPSGVFVGPNLRLSVRANQGNTASDSVLGNIHFESNQGVAGTKEYTRISSAGVLDAFGQSNNYFKLETRDWDENNYTNIAEFKKSNIFLNQPLRIGTDAITHEIDGDIAEDLIDLTPLPDGDGTTQTFVLQTTGALGSEVYSWAAGSGGGSFDPSTDQTITGDWRFTGLFALPSLASNPTGEYSGQQYYNFTDDEVRVYDAGTTTWTAVGGTPFDYTADLTLTKTDPTITLKSDETAADDNEVGKLSFEGLSGTSNNVYAETVVTAIDESEGEGRYVINVNDGTSLTQQLSLENDSFKISAPGSFGAPHIGTSASGIQVGSTSVLGGTLALARQIETPSDTNVIGILYGAYASDLDNTLTATSTITFAGNGTTSHTQFTDRSADFDRTTLVLNRNDANYSALPLRIGADASANEFDDYEEGTWTPTFQTTGIVFTLVADSAIYTKIGRTVNLTATFTTSGTADDSLIGIQTTSLPFAKRANVNEGGSWFSFGNTGGLFFGTTISQFHKSDGVGLRDNEVGPSLLFSATYTTNT